MKSRFLIILGLLALAACKPDLYFQLLSPGRVEVPQQGGAFTVEVNANVPFTIDISEDASPWLRLVSTDEQTPPKYTLEAAPNADVKPRQAILTVKSSLGNEEVSVYQTGENPRWQSIPAKRRFPAWAETLKCRLPAPNETGEPREMSLVFRNAEYQLSDTLQVKQGFRPGFSFTTSRKEVKGPWLKEAGADFRIFWGDGSHEPYSQDLLHSYTQPGSHKVVVEGDPVSFVRFSNLEDGMVIDFSRIKKKEEAQ